VKYFLIVTAVITAALLLSCGSSGDVDDGGTIKINYNELRQVIDGFGGSNAWTRLPGDSGLAEDLVKLLYSRTEGVGFTILRNRIPFRERLPGDNNTGYNDGFVRRNSDHTYSYIVNPDGTKTFEFDWNSWDIASTRNLIRQIQNLGGSGPERFVVMSAPWTPPNNRVTRWKEDVTGLSGNLNGAIDWAMPDQWGRLKREHYNDYADLLADYVLNFESRMSVPLNILSIQNEPNWKASWECCYWDGTDLRDFIKVIADRFPMKGLKPGEGGINIMMPEYENFNINFNNIIKPSLDDPASERIITHIALHQYNGASDASSRAGSREFPEIVASGKRFWQTEVSGSGTHLPAGDGIANAMYYARMIHWDFTLTQMNAFLYWWLWSNTSSDDYAGALIKNDGDSLTAAKRLYAMGQYSRFIRPGWHRINSDTTVRTGTYSSAYRNPQSDEIAVVIINERATAVSAALELEGAQFSELEIYRTSETENLRNAGRQRVSGGTAQIVLAPMSITTFYGRAR